MSNRPNIESAPTAKRVLDDYMRRMRFRSQVYYRGQICETWSLDTSGTDHINFHVICHGDCWLRMSTLREPQHLREGDVVVLPRDTRHLLASDRESPADYGKISMPHKITLDRAAPGTALVCGYVTVDAIARGLMFSTLPDYLIVRASDSPHVRSLIELLFSEAQSNDIGMLAVLDRLSDALMFYVIRHAMEQKLQTSGLLTALADKQICAVLTAINENPARTWTVNNLAEAAFLSRSAFTERFSALVGKAPMEFLTEWRMQLARTWLEQDRISVADAAARCGYQSEAAFSKAFKRIIGTGPGEFRRAQEKGRG